MSTEWHNVTADNLEITMIYVHAIYLLLIVYLSIYVFFSIGISWSSQGYFTATMAANIMAVENRVFHNTKKSKGYHPSDML